MTYKTILTHLDGSPTLSARVELSAHLAKRQDAHLLGVAPAGVATIPGDSYFSITADLIAKMQAEMDNEANAAVEQFEKVCRDMAIDSVESLVVGSIPADIILRCARCSDLVIIGQKDPKIDPLETTQGFVERVVFDAGKPVLVVPNAGHCVDTGQRVLVAWDASREAARAVTDAMPILTEAEAVEVLVVNAKSAHGNSHGPNPGADIALYLARQGVNVKVHSLQSDSEIGDTLLSHAQDLRADLLVMGAYGHSRLREWVLGGATRTVLRTMTIPVLMSH